MPAAVARPIHEEFCRKPPTAATELGCGKTTRDFFAIPIQSISAAGIWRVEQQIIRRVSGAERGGGT